MRRDRFERQHLAWQLITAAASSGVSDSAIQPLYIVGPTASGKSGIALALARGIGGEIVNADAMQMYRGLDLLTAKPSRADRDAVPHHLYDVLDLNENCDAQRYREMALPMIAEIARRGKTPLIVGGSGLYIKALTHGLAPVPPGDAATRERLSSLTLEEQVAMLLQHDPDAARNVPLSNPRYVERALEICLLTGKPQSELRATFANMEISARGIVLIWKREELYARINQRVLDMVGAGALEEVRGIGALSVNAEKAIGIRELRAHLTGETTLEEAVAAMQQATRRYAKRQGTWFRRERWLQTVCLTGENTTESALAIILDLFPVLKT